MLRTKRAGRSTEYSTMEWWMMTGDLEDMKWRRQGEEEERIRFLHADPIQQQHQHSPVTRI